MSTSRVPKYLRQREAGRADRAYTRIDGRKFKLGVYGSPESKAKYAKLISGGDLIVPEPEFEPSSDPNVDELLAVFLPYAQTYYGSVAEIYRTCDGSQSSKEYADYCLVAKWLRRDAGSELAKDFGPKRLKLLREQFIAQGWKRKTINDRVKRVIRIFTWGASEEMFEPKVSDALKTVGNLKHGRSKAKESVPVLPVADEDVTATLEHLPQVVADMARTQRLTGCRPGELIQMRPCDIDRSEKVWLYRPATHKTAHFGHTRVVAIGPKCQEILLSYLARGAEDYLFQPRDSESKRRAVMTEARVVPLSCGNTPGSARVDSPQRQPGEAYTVGSYCRAITRAAKRAKVEPWTPHRLRHTAATQVRREFGLDSAQAVLGHRNAAVTEVYAELNTAKAAAVALRIG